MKTLALLLVLFVPLASSSTGGDIPTQKTVRDNPRQECFLIDPSEGHVPEGGYKLLVVLPGGDGSADFNPFVTNIGKHAVGSEYLVARLIAIQWTPDQQTVWPTEEADVKRAKFTTEEFIRAVISDIQKSHKVNPEHVYTLSWSSGGPAAYAASLDWVMSSWRLKVVEPAWIALCRFRRVSSEPVRRNVV